MNDTPKRPFLSGRRRSIVGIILIALPAVLIFGSIILWSIVTFVSQSVLSANEYSLVPVAHAQEVSADDYFGSGEDEMLYNETAPTLGDTAAGAVRVVLGLAGILGLLSVAGVPFGVYLLATDHPVDRKEEPEATA